MFKKGSAGNTVNQQIAREALAKFPDAPSQTSARAIFKNNPSVFTSLNSARCSVRRARGEMNLDGRAKTKTAQPVSPRTPEAAEAARHCGAGIPEPQPSDFKIYPLPMDVQRWLVAGDIHIPFHDKAALELMFDYAAKQKVDGVLFLGDLLDCYQLSQFTRDPRQRHMKDEIQMAQELLTFTRRKLKLKHVIWKLGNHEHRWDTYLMLKAPELFDVPGCSLPELLRTDQLGVEIVPENCPMQYHKLNILHGHEFGRAFSSPVNPARGMCLRAGACVLSAHEHRTSQHVEPTMDGVNVTTWSMGCLCDLHPRYRSLNKWNTGFALIDTRGGWRIENKRIFKGEIS